MNFLYNEEILDPNLLCSTAYKNFLSHFYIEKKFWKVESVSNFWPIGAGSLKWGRLAGFVQGVTI